MLIVLDIFIMRLCDLENNPMIFFFLQAKQRATIKWLLSKAYNNKIPEELSEPFYKDHEVSNSNYIIKYSHTLKSFRKKKYIKH